MIADFSQERQSGKAATATRNLAGVPVEKGALHWIHYWRGGLSPERDPEVVGFSHSGMYGRIALSRERSIWALD